jgi:hypothetical protein
MKTRRKDTQHTHKAAKKCKEMVSKSSKYPSFLPTKKNDFFAFSLEAKIVLHIIMSIHYST